MEFVVCQVNKADPGDERVGFCVSSSVQRVYESDGEKVLLCVDEHTEAQLGDVPN